MPKGGWENLNKRCPQDKCMGELLAKALGGKHLAVKCTRGDFEMSGRIDAMLAWIRDN